MNKKILGYTTGVFDMFHIGHLRLLKKAKLHCDYLIVGVSSDELVQSYKNKLPIIPLAHRMEIISSLKFVDEVIIQTHRDKLKSFHEIGFNVMFVGDDWKDTPIFIELDNELRKYDARVEYFRYTDQVSSTKFTEILQGIYDDDRKSL
ncbi:MULTISPECIES: adenylyltransferase/cytidyltransferase family protein [unclassified Vibrio]|uniref:adenylyltransferase/cytidyltransferase family protein n=1 Tax=unclassified Vibrio TaxID=2614977 RepID=UPI003552B849